MKLEEMLDGRLRAPSDIQSSGLNLEAGEPWLASMALQYLRAHMIGTAQHRFTFLNSLSTVTRLQSQPEIA
jgi:hypothetical protein